MVYPDEQKQIPPLRCGMTNKLVYSNSGTALTAQDNSTTTNCFHCALPRNIRQQFEQNRYAGVAAEDSKATVAVAVTKPQPQQPLLAPLPVPDL
jgi:hypothetical protein